ncbi:PilZ domain-containing protein [uncultured Sphingomonas sp.]|uniref:PilZ domain-containing protein n=1 Tax=uncultured Sphingomonas sp. TaxID=158754 RepID=UPI0035CBBE08
MSVAAALYREVRESERHSVALDGTLRDPEWKPHDVVVEDLSSTGFRVPTETELHAGAFVSLGLAGVGMCPARVVRQADGQIGCTFLVPLGRGKLKAAMEATSLRPLDLNLMIKAQPPEPKRETISDTRAPRHIRLGVVTGLAAASWAAAIAAANLLAK